MNSVLKAQVSSSFKQIRHTRVIAQLRSRAWQNTRQQRDQNILGKAYWSNLYRDKIVLNAWAPVTAPRLFHMPEQLRIMLQSRKHFKMDCRLLIYNIKDYFYLSKHFERNGFKH